MSNLGSGYLQIRTDTCTLVGPFSHRTMLTMEEKSIPYNKILLDENAMPDWIEEVFGQKQIPFITELDTGMLWLLYNCLLQC